MPNEPTALDAGAVWRGQSPAPYRLSPADVDANVARIERRTFRRFVVASAIAAVEIVAFIACFVAFTGVLLRVGAALTIAAMAFFIIQMRVHSARMSSASINVMKVVRPTLEYYRDDLERRRAFHRGWWFWSRFAVLVPGPLLFFSGLAASFPQIAAFAALEGAAFVFLLLASIWLQRRIARRYERRLTALTRLEDNLR